MTPVTPCPLWPRSSRRKASCSRAIVSRSASSAATALDLRMSGGVCDMAGAVLAMAASRSNAIASLRRSAGGRCTCDCAPDACLRERIERLHVKPRICGARAIEHVDAKRQVVAGKCPRAEQIDVLGAEAVPRCHDRAGVGELAHFNIGAAITEKFDAFGAGAGMTGAVHHQIGAEAADDVTHASDSLIGGLVLLAIHRRFGAK